MSLFGAMNAGVSGLAAQSSAMGAISDNITNVNTVGYKSTKVSFQTLVTRQASSSMYSSGGVEAKPRGGVNVQGLLQPSSSNTDLAISGDGFLVVNESSTPGTSDQFLFTRAGSFNKDDLGYLQNTAGFYLQGWPTDRTGKIILPNGAAGQTNQNIISPQFLETVNLNRVGGTAEETTLISIGATLPAVDEVAAQTKSSGYIAFSALPANGSTITLNGTPWTFVSPGPAVGNQTVIGGTVDATLTALANDLNASVAAPFNQCTYTANLSADRLEIEYDTPGSAGNAVTLAASGASNGTPSRPTLAGGGDIADLNGPGVHAIDVQFFDTLGSTNAVAFTFTKSDTNQWDLTVEPPTNTGSVALRDSAAAVYKSIGQIEFSKPVAAGGETITISGSTYTLAAGLTPAAAALALVNAINAAPPAGWTGTAALKAGDDTAVLIPGDSNVSLTVDPSAAPSTRQSQLVAPGTFTIPQEQAAPPPAIIFGSGGSPSAFGVASMDIDGFANGAASMTGTPNAARIALNFGTIGAANGIKQGDSQFTSGFIEQDGARFGVYVGVTIGTDGLVQALFDNGERRPIYRVPIVTFVNPDGLASQSGNVWNATEASGNPTLRTAGSGPAGEISQASLEASTVDIGEEFTDMIVVQRAYSAATRIISTADEMLEELVRIKR